MALAIAMMYLCPRPAEARSEFSLSSYALRPLPRLCLRKKTRGQRKQLFPGRSKIAGGGELLNGGGAVARPSAYLSEFGRGGGGDPHPEANVHADGGLVQNQRKLRRGKTRAQD